MNMVVTWQKTYIPHRVFENVESFIEASLLVDEAIIQYGKPMSIYLFENHKCIASLRTVR